ncbi:hypothetical protein [Capnocytophaga gingivalis]|uniref:hypothetical protein n=1 Tax=Capnocytophaga gingivalis TaxID=1017 RepID=UPI0028E80F2E|nr:hypothetical protein [Capnocytophaga gingivalis]
MYNELLTIENEIVTTSDDLGLSYHIGNWAIPPSYYEFCKELGYGLLLELFLTYIPMGKGNPFCDSLENQNIYLKNIIKEYLEVPLMLFEDSDNYDLIAHAEPFMFSENGEIVFWDIRESKDGEYPIYLVDFSVGVYYAGANFKEFIINLTDKNTYKKILTFRENPLMPKFRPLKMLQ